MNTPGKAYIERVCGLYGDAYDDREEDSRIGGENWNPGVRAAHKSIRLFREELKNVYGMELSRCKIQKILITGGRWSTERSREVTELFGRLTAGKDSGGEGLAPGEAVRRIAEHLGLSTAAVSINLPYMKTVYALEEKSRNARRIEKCRERKNHTD